MRQQDHGDVLYININIIFVTNLPLTTQRAVQLRIALMEVFVLFDKREAFVASCSAFGNIFWTLKNTQKKLSVSKPTQAYEITVLLD